MSIIKNENFVAIQGWMVNELGLKGNALIIYAVIYGFCQLDGHSFSGSLQYLADWTNSTKQGVLKSIKKLLDGGLITKKEKFVNNVKIVEYNITKLNSQLNKVKRCVKQSLPNNIDNNIEQNIDTISKDIGEIPKKYGNEGINLLFDEWEKYCGFRIDSKIKLNRYACQRLIKSKGLDNVMKVIPLVAKSQGMQYAPSINNFIDLAEKWNNLGVWYKRQKPNGSGDYGIIRL